MGRRKVKDIEMRKIIVAGNWKMNKNREDAIEFATVLCERIGDVDEVEVVICPPYTYLECVGKTIFNTKIFLGAQDVHWERNGAYTGEISCEMLLDIGCKYVIIGHSERRQHLGETDGIVNKKLKRALESGLLPILCVGETLEEREGKQTMKVVERQCRAAFDGVSPESAFRTVIAYEPVWAIGTGRNATPKQAEEVQKFIRKVISDIFGFRISVDIRIQYGGSVREDNISELIGEEDIDGVLVGGASLETDSFVGIVESCVIEKGQKKFLDRRTNKKKL